MKLHPDIANLLAEIDAFIERSGMTRTAFGLAAVNNGNLHQRLRQGDFPTFRTIAKVRAFMRDRERSAA